VGGDEGWRGLREPSDREVLMKGNDAGGYLYEPVHVHLHAGLMIVGEAEAWAMSFSRMAGLSICHRLSAGPDTHIHWRETNCHVIKTYESIMVSIRFTCVQSSSPLLAFRHFWRQHCHSDAKLSVRVPAAQSGLLVYTYHTILYSVAILDSFHRTVPTHCRRSPGQ
jgi:hypothetical protein